MSDRSSAWYAIEANAARRKARMRAYGKALVELGRRYQEERSREYQDARGRGLAFSAAEAAAFRAVRNAHHQEFEKIFEEKRRECSPPESAGQDAT